MKLNLLFLDVKLILICNLILLYHPKRKTIFIDKWQLKKNG